MRKCLWLCLMMSKLNRSDVVDDNRHPNLWSMTRQHTTVSQRFFRCPTALYPQLLYQLGALVQPTCRKDLSDAHLFIASSIVSPLPLQLRNFLLDICQHLHQRNSWTFQNSKSDLFCLFQAESRFRPFGTGTGQHGHIFHRFTNLFHLLLAFQPLQESHVSFPAHTVLRSLRGLFKAKRLSRVRTGDN